MGTFLGTYNVSAFDGGPILFCFTVYLAATDFSEGCIHFIVCLQWGVKNTVLCHCCNITAMCFAACYLGWLQILWTLVCTWQVSLLSWCS